MNEHQPEDLCIRWFQATRLRIGHSPEITRTAWQEAAVEIPDHSLLEQILKPAIAVARRQVVFE